MSEKMVSVEFTDEAPLPITFNVPLDLATQLDPPVRAYTVRKSGDKLPQAVVSWLKTSRYAKWLAPEAPKPSKPATPPAKPEGDKKE